MADPITAFAAAAAAIGLAAQALSGILALRNMYDDYHDFPVALYDAESHLKSVKLSLETVKAGIPQSDANDTALKALLSVKGEQAYELFRGNLTQVHALLLVTQSDLDGIFTRKGRSVSFSSVCCGPKARYAVNHKKAQDAMIRLRGIESMATSLCGILNEYIDQMCLFRSGALTSVT
jgi:hypothetical protein